MYILFKEESKNIKILLGPLKGLITLFHATSFRGYRKGPVAWNGLRDIYRVCFDRWYKT